MDAAMSTGAVANAIPNLPADFVSSWGDWSGKIVDAAKAQANAVRVCQKVFNAELVPQALAVPDDSLDLPIIDNVPEKDKRTLVEITIPFRLTSMQMGDEPNTKIAYSLAQVDGRAIGQVEDLILFQGVNANKNPLYKLVTVKNVTGNGLLGAAEPAATSDTDPNLVSVPIDVYLEDPPRRPGVQWGENLFAAVNSGVTNLSGKGQSTHYALILPIEAYADLQTPPGNQSLVTTYDRLKDWLTAGIYPTAMLPPDRGLLVAVSNAIALYVGVDAQTEYTAKDQSFHNLLIRDKFQFIARDPRALVLLKLHKSERP